MSFLIFLLFLSFPTQLAKHFWPDFSYVWGIRVDYLSPAIYLSDILFLAIVIPFIFRAKLKIKKTFNYRYILVALFILINIAFSKSPELSFLRWIKLSELGLLVWFISSYRFTNFKRQVVLPLAVSAAAISFIGILQFIKGSTIGGVLYFLGERSFNLISPGISLIDIGGREFLRAYSTFSHPNSLAGYLLVVGILIICFGKGFRLLIVPVMVCFILAFSKGAFIALFIVIFLFIAEGLKIAERIKKSMTNSIINLSLLLIVLFSLLMFIWTEGSFLENIRISERIDLMKVSKELILTSPLVGVGLNNFIPKIPDYIVLLKTGWLLQPVHNIFVLFSVEGGVIGLGLFLYLIRKSLNNALKNSRICLVLCLFVIVITGLFDHYWLTLQQNILLMALVFGLTFRTEFK